MQGPCFYCGRQMRYVTRDHLIARAYLRGMEPMTHEWHAINVVKVCAECNEYKGKLKSLDWLVIMPAYGAAGVAKKMIKLGVDRDAVARALARRPEAVSCT